MPWKSCQVRLQTKGDICIAILVYFYYSVPWKSSGVWFRTKDDVCIVAPPTIIHALRPPGLNPHWLSASSSFTSSNIVLFNCQHYPHNPPPCSLHLIIHCQHCQHQTGPASLMTSIKASSLSALLSGLFSWSGARLLDLTRTNNVIFPRQLAWLGVCLKIKLTVFGPCDSCYKYQIALGLRNIWLHCIAPQESSVMSKSWKSLGSFSGRGPFFLQSVEIFMRQAPALFPTVFNSFPNLCFLGFPRVY